MRSAPEKIQVNHQSCELHMIADYERPTLTRKLSFLSHFNRIAWKGHRFTAHQVCGGGQRIIRKKIGKF